MRQENKGTVRGRTMVHSTGGGGLRTKEVPQGVKLAKINKDGAGGARLIEHFAEDTVGRWKLEVIF